jgi:cytochrome b6-f complex iron-sulfur subunit
MNDSSVSLESDVKMSRREMLKAAGLLAAAVGIGRPDRLFADDADKPWVIVGAVKDFPPGTVKALDKEKIVVVSDKEGVHAMSLVCTHKKGPLVYKEKKGGLVCKWHGAVFDMEGTAMKKPAKVDLPWYEVTLDNESVVVDRSKTVEKGVKVRLPEVALEPMPAS